MKKIVKTLLIVLAFAMLASALYACGGDAGNQGGSAPAPAPAAPGANTVASPLPGTILRVNVAVGQAVKAGDVLLVLEAMKMENDITAPGNGVVSAIHVASGATVQTGDALVSL